MKINRPAHRDLEAGTILRHTFRIQDRIRVTWMKDDFAAVHRIRQDGERDRRHNGWSGRLLLEEWVVVPTLAHPGRR